MKENLKFKNGKFKIMLVGDPHEKAADETPRERAILNDYLRLQNTALDKIQPDLVVFMGDNAGGDTIEDLQKAIRRIVSPIKERNIPLAVVFGNHDLEKKINDPQDHIDTYNEYENSRFTNASPFVSYRGDYNLYVYDEENNKPIYNLWFMYSGNRAPKEYHSKYDFVRPEQIEWYEESCQKIAEENGGEVLPALLFQHIPVPEEYRLLKEVGPCSLLFDGVPGLNGKHGKYFVLDRKNTDVMGYMGEAPCPPDYNSGQFDSWKNMGDIKGAFFGHDHMNDFVGTVDGIALGQVKLSGFRQYGDGLMQGVRVIELDSSDLSSFDTYMRYYRDMIGSDCESIHGSLKWLSDRQSVKLETSLKVLGVGAAVAAPFVLYKKLRKRK